MLNFNVEVVDDHYMQQDEWMLIEDASARTLVMRRSARLGRVIGEAERALRLLDAAPMVIPLQRRAPELASAVS